MILLQIKKIIKEPKSVFGVSVFVARYFEGAFSFYTIMEVLKPIIGYEGSYEISNLGYVKSLKRSRVLEDKILTPYLMGNPKRKYFAVKLGKNGIEGRFKIHRLVAIHFIENPFNKPIVHHKDNNPFNNCASNLEWATSKENINYRYALKK